MDAEEEGKRRNGKERKDRKVGIGMDVKGRSR